MSEGGELRGVTAPGERVLILCEGDRDWTAGRDLAELWGGIELFDVKPLSGDEQLELNPTPNPLTEGVEPDRPISGMSFSCARPVDNWMYFYPDPDERVPGSARSVVVQRENVVILGFDFHAYRDWHMKLFLNACERGSSGR